jgi:hypothetical protein
MRAATLGMSQHPASATRRFYPRPDVVHPEHCVVIRSRASGRNGTMAHIWADSAKE